MRKFILLFCTVIFSFSAKSQIVTVYEEDFDTPPYQVTFGDIGSPPIQWNDTSNLFRSAPNAFHLKLSRANTTPPPTNTQVWFQTDPFSTLTTPYVFLTFKHIAKINYFNRGEIEISVDGGSTWTVIDSMYYRGNSTSTSGQYQGQERFNEATYFGSNNLWIMPQNVQPNNTWWVTEQFDLTDLASDLSNAVGYADVRLRFKATANFTPFKAGWWIDDIKVTASSCELEPPKFNFAIPGPCEEKPEKGQVGRNDSLYAVGSIVTDVNGYNTGVDSVSLYYSVNGATPFSQVTMSLSTGSYGADIPNIGVGDTVRWYLVAEDNGCPLLNLNNSARTPDPLYFSDNVLTSDSAQYMGFYTFWVDSALPAKCGAPYCGAYATVIESFPHTIDFEGNEWALPSAPQGGKTRGVPTSAPYYWENQAGGATSAAFGWTVNSGPTPGSPFTGPLSNHTPGGSKYLYLHTQTTPVQPTGRIAQINTPCISLKNAPGCLGMEFYYHMYGSDINELRVEIDTGSNNFDFHKDYKVIKNQQQQNQSDPWQRAVISLEPFIGKIIRIRFRGLKGNGPDDNIAIDDIRFFEPDPVDMIVLSVDEPKNGYCDPGSEPVKIMVVNNGCSSISSIPVSYRVSGGAVVQETLNQTLKLGDTATYTFTQLPTFPGFGNYTITAWTGAAGDSDNSNDTATGKPIEYSASISTFPFFEDFENGQYLTQNLGNSNFIFSDGVKPNFKWQVGKEFTQTRNTGPDDGYHYEGQYLYAASNGTSGNGSTYMRTRCLDLSSFTNPNDSIALEFYYHAYGSNIDKLEVQASAGDEDINTWTTLTTIFPAQANQNSEFDPWKFKRVLLNNYKGGSVKVRFKASRKGSGDRTDLAIDKIRIYKLIPNDAGVMAVEKPGGRVSLSGPKNPTVGVINFGSTTLKSCTVHYKVTRLCNQAPPQTYSQYFSGLSVGPGSQVSLQLNTAGVVYPPGEYEVKAYTSGINGTNSTNGDTYRFNDTIHRNIIGIGSYNIPFENNFDPCNYEIYGTYPDGGLQQWELGTPSGSGNITTPRSSPNAWVTNLDGNFLVGTKEKLVMPILEEFDTVYKAELRFWQNIDFGNSGSSSDPDVAGTVTYIDQGQPKVLGSDFQSSRIGINWHGGCLGTGSSSLFNNQPAFIKSTTPKPDTSCVAGIYYSNGWVYTMYPLDEFNGNPAAQLALSFEFASDGIQQSQATGGWGIDDFSIHIPPQNSARPIRVRTEKPLPFPGFDQELIITIENTGGKPLDSVKVDVYVDGLGGTRLNATPEPHSLGGIPRGSSREINFRAIWPAAQVTSGVHEVCVITSRPNGKPDAIPGDDTLCSNIIIIKEIDLSSIGDSEYCDDFENPTDYGWISANSKDYSQKSSWEEGTPVQFTGSHSGNTAWMTDLNDNYIDGDASALITPIFQVDSGQIYAINFWHQMESEKYHDGGNVEYSLDGGETWYAIGWAIPGRNKWYSDPFVTALDQIRSGWTDTTGGWVEAFQRVSFEKDTKVILRFRFGADFDINKSGWAIDDFCLSKDDTSQSPDYRIGLDENKIVQDVIIGHLAPNPASYSSELAFSLPDPQIINVKVYNVLGQMVESSENKYQEGIHKMNFETSTWESGIYFIHLEFDGRAVTRKLIISN